MSMKKILNIIIIILALVVLSSCKPRYSKEFEDLMNKYEEYSRKIDELLKSKDEIIDDLSGEIKNLEEMIDQQRQLVEDLKENDKKFTIEFEKLLTMIDELNELVKKLESDDLFEIEYTQIGDSLSTKITSHFPKVIENYSFSKAEIKVNHPLKEVYGFDSLIKKLPLGISTSIEIDVDYHGLYEIQYEIIYDNGIEEIIYNISKPMVVTTQTVNISWLNGTMPTLLFASDLLTGKYDEGHTYVEIERSKTYNFEELPENAHKFPVYASAGQGDYEITNNANFWDFVKIQTDGRALHWVRELYLSNPSIYINFAMVDNVIEAMNGMYSLGIPEDNFGLTLYTDGTYTSNWLNQHIKNDSQIQYYDNVFDNWRDKKLSNPTKFIDLNLSTVLASSILPNIEYVVNETDSWLIKDSAMLNRYNLRVIDTKTAFSLVDDAGNIEKLEKLFKTRWGSNDQEGIYDIFAQSPKKNLLILGTSPSGELNNNYATFDKYIDFIVQEYSGEYDIFYKGHPRYPSDEDRVIYFEENNIIELQNSIPVETLMLLYDDVFVGGYAGTSFVSSLENQTVFLFGSKQYILSSQAALKVLIEEGIIFNNTVFLGKDSNGDVILD